MSEAEDFDSILDNEPEPEVEPEVVTEVAEPDVEAEKDTEVAEKATETDDKAETKEGTTTSEKEPWTLTAVMDERQKRQEWERKAQEYEEKLKAYESPESDVSVFEDEGKFKEKIQQESEVKMHNALLGISKAYAERELGAEVVAEAEEWYAKEGTKSPYMVQKVHESNLKFHTVVDLYNEEKTRRTDPSELKAQLRAEILAELKSEEKPKTTITPSLASKRSAGADKHNTEDFEDILGA